MDDRNELKTPVVFLSHSSKDREVVARLCEALEAGGFPCWMAPRDILSSTEWAEAIMVGLETSRIFLLVLSDHSNRSSQVVREITNAAHLGHTLIPFRIQDVNLSRVMQYFLSDVHWFDAVTLPLESHFPNLLATIGAALKSRDLTLTSPAPSPVLVQDSIPGVVPGAAPGATPASARPPDLVTNSLGMRLKLVPAATFTMGSASGHPDETPPHRVTLSRPLYVGVFPVSQEEYQAVTGSNPSRFPGPRRPVESVSWHDAVGFCRKLAEKEGRPYRLPTEAEWEFACGAGSPTAFFWGDAFRPDGGWCQLNAGSQTREVGSTIANPHGLYDLAGNVFEWCLDWYDLYMKKDQVDPQGPPGGDGKSVRGGSFRVPPFACRTTFRGQCPAGERSPAVGFRVCLPLDEGSPTATA